MSFARPSVAEHQARRAAEKAENQRVLCLPARTLHVSTYAGTLGPAIEKGEPARPGKRPQTKAESLWIAQVVVFGCAACWLEGRRGVPPEVHHVTRGGVRMGHHYSFGLCPGHHRRGAGPVYMIARHPEKAAFEAKYGTEWQLLATVRDEIGVERLSDVQRGVDREIARQLRTTT